MISIVGFDDVKEEWKLFNSDIKGPSALRTCPYSFNSQLLGGQGDKSPEEWRLRRQTRNLRRYAGTSGEFHILYYSCDYDFEQLTIRNIRVHLTDGSEMTPSELLLQSSALLPQEIGQLSRFNGDSMQLPDNKVYRIGEALISNGSFDTSVVSEVHTYYMVVRGTELVLVLACGKFYYGEDQSYNNGKDGYSFMLATSKATETWDRTEIVYRPESELEAGLYNISEDTFDREQNTHRGTYSRYTKYSLASRLFRSKEELFGMNATSDYDVKLKALDSFEYLMESGIVNMDKLVLHKGIFDIGQIKEEANSIARMYDNMQMYGGDGNLRIVIDGVLKAVIPSEIDKVTVDLSGIKTVDPGVFVGYKEITFVCTGELVLKEFLAHSPLLRYKGDKNLLDAVTNATPMKDKIYARM